VNRLLFILIIALSFSCEDVCDATVYGTNDDGSTYEECVVYNDWLTGRFGNIYQKL